ncbi:hypothetical protein RAK27_09835 [Carnobacterium maltaromaticum]|uniref:Uncharacterized protein n=1 Tax=Carnobacterium maltaromaticum TaxID=2751 RepID=A0AAW9JZB9_CARML|nr:hypothetical protein [Carnobacterium maltaromaticum]MDZ5758955.1 hypothetical protein [Carnobacterium maltaromaticum]
MTLNELIRRTTQSQRARIVRFSVAKGLARSGNESIIIEGCNVLKAITGITTMQYAHVSELDAFLNFSNNPVHAHYKNGTSVADDLLNGKSIYNRSYK